MKFWALLALLLAGWFAPGTVMVFGQETDRILINVVGDIMLGGSAMGTFEKSGYDYPFDETAPYFRAGDVNFANLETPVTREGEPIAGKQFTFRMSPDAVPSLAKVGFNLLSLANNHIMDYGEKGLAQTLSILRAYHVGFSGAGPNEAQARLPAVIRVKGKKIALLAYSAVLPASFYAGKDRAGTAFAFEESLRSDIPLARKESDFLIVSFHWGRELQSFPEEYQIRLAHRAIDLGADLIVGHHPHVLQGIEVYQGRPIFYSLGNFAFSSYSPSVHSSILAELTLIGNRIEQIELIALNVYNPVVDVRPRVLSGEDAEAVIDEVTEASWPFGTSIGWEADRGWVILR